jgi:hypothetical protein
VTSNGTFRYISVMELTNVSTIQAAMNGRIRGISRKDVQNIEMYIGTRKTMVQATYLVVALPQSDVTEFPQYNRYHSLVQYTCSAVGFFQRTMTVTDCDSSLSIKRP